MISSYCWTGVDLMVRVDHNGYGRVTVPELMLPETGRTSIMWYPVVPVSPGLVEVGSYQVLESLRATHPGTAESEFLALVYARLRDAEREAREAARRANEERERKEREAALRRAELRRVAARRKTIFVRWGDIPAGGRSRDYRDDRLEAGVAVVRAWYDRDHGYMLDGNGVNIFSIMCLSSGRQAHVVDGIEIGTCSDGTPVLESCRIVRQIGRNARFTWI